MKTLHVFYSWLCFIAVNFAESKCPEGSCKSVRECEPAVRAVQTKGSHDFPSCGFDGNTEVVCCYQSPAEIQSKSTGLLRKSDEACQSFKLKKPPVIKLFGMGKDANVGEFPHMVALGFVEDDAPEIAWGCGGSLISDQWVLTAAHCVNTRISKKLVRIRMGVVDITNRSDEQPTDYEVDHITSHPKYSRSERINDIALVKLKQKVLFTTNVYPACLYDKPDDPSRGTATGWGTVGYLADPSDILQKANLVTVPLPECNVTHTSVPLGRAVAGTHICANSTDGNSDSCPGDSGGPLQIEFGNIYKIAGIVSYGRGCTGTFPGVYTRVYSYLEWIESYVWP